jgi:transposase
MALAAQIAQAGEISQVVLEATYGWYWAADVLQDAGAEVHLAHPPGVKGFACRWVKNDVGDAADLADLLRMDRLPEGWIAPPQVRELREMVRHRAKLVAWRSVPTYVLCGLRDGRIRASSRLRKRVVLCLTPAGRRRGRLLD